MIFVDGCTSGRLTFLGVNIWLWYMMLPYLGYGSFVENLTSHGSQGTLISSLLRELSGRSPHRWGGEAPCVFSEFVSESCHGQNAQWSCWALPLHENFRSRISSISCYSLF